MSANSQIRTDPARLQLSSSRLQLQHLAEPASWGSYAVALALSFAWTTPDKWDWRCGTLAASHAQLCYFWFVAMGACAVVSGFGFYPHRGRWSAARRFLVSGSVPIVLPYFVSLVGSWFVL